MTPATLLEKLAAAATSYTASTVLAGSAGGMMRWITLRERPRDGLVSLVGGAICALYLGPLGVPMLEPVVGPISGNSAGLASFVVGLAGVSLTGLILDVVRLAGRLRRGHTSDHGQDGGANG